MSEMVLQMSETENSNPFNKVRDFIREDGSRFQKWEGERYIVIIDFFGEHPYVRTSIKPEISRYLPHIYIDTDCDSNPIGISIQTTSYGALTFNEYEQYLNALQQAGIDAHAIDNFFVQPLREKRFEKGDLLG